MLTPESKLAKEIQLYCGQRNWIIIRQQSGLFYDQNGNMIRIGFPGLSDYLILTDTGIPIFAELKVRPNKPTKEQLHFINVMNARGVRAGVIYSIEDLENLVHS